MLIDLIAGARPNFMKIASIIRAIEKRAEISGAFGYRLVHTGQHYDQNMSATFFKPVEFLLCDQRFCHPFSHPT